jgi:hypothetical protein
MTLLLSGVVSGRVTFNSGFSSSTLQSLEHSPLGGYFLVNMSDGCNANELALNEKRSRDENNDSLLQTMATGPVNQDNAVASITALYSLIICFWYVPQHVRTQGG